MKVLLAYPYWIEARASTEDIAVVPMGLWYVAAMLAEHGHEVVVRNWCDKGGRLSEAAEELRAINPDIVGFSVLQANRLGAMELARLAKATLPGCTVVFGGVAATFLWDFFLRACPELDFVVRGEGEMTMLELADALASAHVHPTDIDPVTIRGLAWRRDGAPTANPDRPRVADLDSLPNPSQRFAFHHLSLTRGCPGRCRFCGSPAFWGPKVRFHSPQYFVDQIQAQVERGQRFFYFSDDTFTLDRDRAMAVCRLIIERGLDIEFNAISRVNLVDRELLAAMRRAGCIQISFGVESASPEIRQRLGKNIRDQDIRKAFAMATAVGILARAYIIYGNPGETWEHIQANMALLDDIRPLVTHFFVLALYPGTALFDDFAAKGTVDDELWLEPVEDIKYFETDPDLPEERVREYGRTMKAHYFASLPDHARAVELDDDPTLAPFQADFLARLGGTFEHGDYADNQDIPGKAALAADLYNKAANLFPDATAYMGLGRVLARYGHAGEAEKILREGLGHFPEHPDMQLGLAVALMNQGRFAEALPILDAHPDTGRTAQLILGCRSRLGI